MQQADGSVGVRYQLPSKEKSQKKRGDKDLKGKKNDVRKKRGLPMGVQER